MIKIGDYVKVWSNSSDPDIRYIMCEGVITGVDNGGEIPNSYYWVEVEYPSGHELVPTKSKAHRFHKDQVFLDKSRMRIKKINKITGE